MAVLVVDNGQSLWVGMLAGILVGTAIGSFYALLYTRVGVPSFVFSLAGLLAFQGALLYVLGDNGTINLPIDSGLREFARERVPHRRAGLRAARGRRRGLRRLPAAYGATPSRSGPHAAQPVRWSRSRARCCSPGSGSSPTTSTSTAAGATSVVLFAALVVAMDLVLRKTSWGRHVFAVGGNEEAARRSGIKVGRIYFSVFVPASTFAALGGILLAGQLTSVSQSSGTTDTNLTAIAAAVIGGTSLFGGRGTAYSALLGILVLQAIQNGLNLMNVDSSVRFMVTGAVLLLAVAIDSVSRRARSSSGRG